MQITFSLSLPRDASTVPIVRRISRDALDLLGVRRTCIEDIELATSEACTNVLQHVEGTADQYEVQIEVNPAACEIKVVDSGGGFDASLHQNDDGEPSMTAEGGRGIFLMQAAVDRLEFISEPEHGTVVHLLKRLELEDDAVLKELEDPIKS